MRRIPKLDRENPVVTLERGFSDTPRNSNFFGEESSRHGNCFRLGKTSILCGIRWPRDAWNEENRGTDNYCSE